MGPYRSSHLSTWQADELWLRLDEALGMAFRDPRMAYQFAWDVWIDSRLYPDVRRAASDLMTALVGVDPVT